VRFCRAAFEAGHTDLAEVFAERLPGVREGLLMPVWKLPPDNSARPDETVETRGSVPEKVAPVRQKLVPVPNKGVPQTITVLVEERPQGPTEFELVEKIDPKTGQLIRTIGPRLPKPPDKKGE
jgi:hypothetical protein